VRGEADRVIVLGRTEPKGTRANFLENLHERENARIFPRKRCADQRVGIAAEEIGIGVGDGSHGMIYESHGASRSEVEATVRKMIDEGFARRGLRLKEVVVRSIEHKVERIGCAVAAVVLWWR